MSEEQTFLERARHRMSSSRDYILHWRGTVEGLGAALERIQRAAKEILLAVETPVEVAA